MKSILNSLWGKFCQNSNKMSTFFVTDSEELWNILCDKRYESVYMNKIDSGTLRLSCKTKPNYTHHNNFTSLAIACYVTCFARLELLKKLHALPDKSILYFDTYSILYFSENSDSLIKEGDKLGEMASELDENEHITSFCSTGSKSYTYTTSFQKDVTHVKGFKIVNQKNCKESEQVTSNDIYNMLDLRKKNFKKPSQTTP